MIGRIVDTGPLPVEFRLAKADEVPASARRLGDLAAAHGWAVEYTYARIERGGGELLVSVAVRLQRREPDAVLAGVWLNGRFYLGVCRRARLRYGDLKQAVVGPAAYAAELADAAHNDG